ncbi:MAG TPA: hypothetical protein VGP36_25300 [Mycobacteriales bacterium]|nr:hypothetical protein [Mycobacteriales bacterium]
MIPTSGINGAEEQERRATSALLAVMTAVREFGRALTAPLGAPAGTVETFIEVPFVLGESKVIPDGLIRVRRGQKVWNALVEVKTGQHELATAQLEAYLDVAREQGFDALITISNEIPPAAGQHPTAVDKRKLRRVALHHLSWSQVLSEAVMQKEHRGIADPDQAWILGELIRYLEHPRSGALEFDDMGPAWVGTREAIVAGTLRAADPGAAHTAERFDALLRYTSLKLGRQLGTEVSPVAGRREDPVQRTAAAAAELASTGVLRGAIKIPNAIAPLVVTADLRAGRLTCHVDVDAPREGRATTRVNWLVRQLRAAPETVRVEASVAHSRGPGAAELLKVVRAEPGKLVTDPHKDLRSFRVASSSSLGSKRGRGRGSFIDSVLDAVDAFYGEILQNLKAWSAAPPKLREEPEPPTRPVALVSTALSSQDGTEEAPAVAPFVPEPTSPE